MRKMALLFLVLFFAVAAFPVLSFADWSVTVSWTASVGPGLDHEDVLLDDVVQCTVVPPAPTTCNFVVATLNNQEVKVRSYNAQGAYADTAPVILSPTPAPATGVVVNITYIP